MKRKDSARALFIERLQPTMQLFIHDKKRKDWGLSIYFVRPFSSKEVTYASMLGRVMESSCERYPSLLSVSRREEELYGSHVYSNIESFSDQSVLGFHLRLLRDEYVDERLSEEAIDYLSDILFSPKKGADGFDQETFEVERERLLDAMSSFSNDPMNLAYAGALRGCLKGDIGLLPMEQKEVLEDMTPQSLWAYYRDLFSQAKRYLIVKGPFEETTVGTISPLSPYAPELLPKVERVEEGSFSQSVMVQMYTTSIEARDPQALPLYLFTALWGTGASSLLFEKVREEMGLCYGISADYSRSLGLVSVSVAFLRDDHEKLQCAIRQTLETLQKEGVSEEVFVGMKAEIRSAMINRSEGIGSDLSTVFYRSLMGETIDLQERIHSLDSVTLDDVLAAGQTLSYHSSFSILGGEE